ncbi:hypothetical protein Bbelb_068040 [Branchiostoma belcheri]|nr:hypothetical protein Bbelb_068040 [Branchiostoma belcheri]
MAGLDTDESVSKLEEMEVPQVRRGTQREVCSEEKHHVNRPASRAAHAAHFHITEAWQKSIDLTGPALKHAVLSGCGTVTEFRAKWKLLGSPHVTQRDADRHSPQQLRRKVGAAVPVCKRESVFQKTEDDIERVTRQLETDFALEKSEGQEQTTGQEKDVPQEVLVQRLGQVKKEYSSLVREAEEVRKMQEEMSLFFQSKLMEACQMLQQLQTAATGPEKVSKLMKTCQMLQQLQTAATGPETVSKTHGGLSDAPAAADSCIGP